MASFDAAVLHTCSYHTGPQPSNVTAWTTFARVAQKETISCIRCIKYMSKCIQVGPCESKWAQVSPSEPKSAPVSPSDSKWIQMNPSESKSDRQVSHIIHPTLTLSLVSTSIQFQLALSVAHTSRGLLYMAWACPGLLISTATSNGNQNKLTRAPCLPVARVVQTKTNWKNLGSMLEDEDSSRENPKKTKKPWV